MKIRERESELVGLFNKNKLSFDESTYHYSSREKEEEFINAQFQTQEEIEKYREYRKEWHRRADEMDPGDFPLAVICELVSFCNLKCQMCYTATPEFQDSIVGAQRMLRWDIVKNIIDECVSLGVYSMLFSWRGEASLYRSKGKDGNWHDFADVLDYARKKGILEVTSLTNGRALSIKLIEKLIKAQPNWISFSIDGLNSAYNKIRRPVSGKDGDGNFRVVVSNLKKMIKFRNKLGLKRPQIRTNTIYPPIADNAAKYRTFMEKIGVGLVTVNELLDFRGAEIPQGDIMDNWFCQYLFQRLTVSANGVILSCPGAHNEEEDLILGRYKGSPQKKVSISGKNKILDIPEIGLREAWKSLKIKEIRAMHRENKRKEIRTCRQCRHGAKKHGVTWIPKDWNMDKMEWIGKAWRE